MSFKTYTNNSAIIWVMFFASIISDYFVWHYTQAWWQMWGVWRNFLFVVIHYFSITQLMRSWFAPFKRTTQARGNKFDLEDLAGYIIINFLSRVFGAVARTAIIVVGLIALMLTIVGGFITYLFWMVAPFLIIGLLGASISLFLI